MDSGNSGSLQSSSGGDEEYDSRAADSVSPFMSGGPISNPGPPFFDPLSSYLQLHHNPNSNLSCPRINSAPSLRSDPPTQEVMLPASNAFMPPFHPTTSPDVAPPTRNPKKRSRASRRAPTTVLTTDTTNFRAMVQEFTGIPAPPFNSSPFPRTRFDLFGPRSDASQPPPYLRRPFPHKLQPPHPFLASSFSAAALEDSTNNNATASTSTPPPINYITNTSNLFNIPNHNILASLLQSNPKFPFSTSPSKPQNSFDIPSSDHQTKIGSLEDQFGLSHNNQTLAGLIPSDHNDGQETSNVARLSNPEGDKLDLRQLNGSYDFTMSEKMSFTASSTSGLHGGKAPENVAATAVRGGGGGEGMVESWICSSE